ncbi:MAG: TraC family protein [Patescibacteria group bacterium]
MADKKSKLAKPKVGPPTQRYLDIAEIREDVVIMKDGTLRAVLLVSSINFALKSEDEQQATVQGYMQFLNSLEHPIQVVIQSRKMNIDGYMAQLKQQEDTIANELLKTQIRDYMSFVSELVELGEIMQKQFFVVVPYDPSETNEKRKSFLTRLQSAFSPARLLKLNTKQFKDRRDSLIQRVANVAGGLQSMGLQTAVLDTQSLIELYYTCYNPQILDTQKLVDLNKLQVETKF